ncbi:MAG: biotin/lipoyl-binding protein [Anaerolineales bacterium]|nr:biotin/lipoyl-binding protein [Anaerolineales bacterium]
MKYITTVGEHTFEIEIEEKGTVLVNGEARPVDLQEIVPGRLYSLLLDNVSHEAFLQDNHRNHFDVLYHGNLFRVQVEDERAIRMARGLADFIPDSGEIPIQAPMPGLVTNMPVAAGQQVKEGDVLVVLESMKMDNELCAPRTGTVVRLYVQTGDSVERNQTLVTLV